MATRHLLLLGLIFNLVHCNLLTVNRSLYTFTFTQSTSNVQLWTAPATYRVKTTDTNAPAATGSTLSVSCAREELESFQIIIGPTATASATVSWTSFSNLAAGAWIDVGVAQFSASSNWAFGAYQATDYTNVITSGATVSLSSTLPTVLWITAYVPGASSAGTKDATFTITPLGGSAIAVPVSLYVFNFVLARTPHFDTFMMSQPTITVSTLDDLDRWKENYLQHRMQYPDPAWPDGLNEGVGWDCTTKTLIDVDNTTSTQQCIWANGCTVKRYAMGKGSTWRGTTYPDWIDKGFSSFQFESTDNGRPSPFCSVSCSTPSNATAFSGWMCSAAYEAEWGRYLAALEAYAISSGMYADPEYPSKGFWYTQNEPQNFHDYTISAYLCSQSRKYAPTLKLLLSREALPEIAERPEYGNCGYDIWMAHIWRFTTTYTWARQANKGETSWFYTLDSDGNCETTNQCNGAFFPAVSNTGSNGGNDPIAINEGMHYRIIPWVAWALRVSGWGYYHDDIFWDTRAPSPAPSRPRISAALLREGLEDYEYLYLANGGARPRVYAKESVDDSVLSLAFAVGIWQNDPEALHALRHELGKKIEGTRADFPYYELSPGRAFGDYYIDFKNTTDNTPFAFNGQSWIPIGWQKYSISNGFGWNSQYMGVINAVEGLGNPVLFCQDAGAGNTIESTICYDNYNHPDEFWFAIAPGQYNVTVAVGWPGKCRSDTEFVSVNNVVLRNYTGSPCVTGVREYSALVTVNAHANGGALVMTLGNNQGYTILSYMYIIGISASTPATTTTQPGVATTLPGRTTTKPTATTTKPAGGGSSASLVYFSSALLLFLLLSFLL